MHVTFTVLHVYRRFWTWKYTFPDAVIQFFYVCTWKFCVPLQSYSRCGVFWQQFSLHGSVAEAPGWSTILALDSGFGCWIVQVHHPVPPQGYRAGLSPVLPAEPPLPLREFWAMLPHKYVTQWHSCSCCSLPVVHWEPFLPLQTWECVDTPEIGLYVSDCKEPALVSKYSQSAGQLIPCK